MQLASFLEASPKGRLEMVLRVADRLPPRFQLDWNPDRSRLPRFRDHQTQMAFILIPGGEFRMGLSHEEEREARRICDRPNLNIWEMRPVRDVTVRAFLVSETPVLYQLVAGATPDPINEHQLHCPAFVPRDVALEIAASQGCRLPSEREWEYACRAGTQTLFTFGDSLPPADMLARWLSSDFSDLAKLNANGFGLYGIFTGEWCQDRFRETLEDDAPLVEGSFAVRGGAAFFWPWQDEEWVWCISAMRMPSRDLANGRCGLRLIHGIGEPAE